MKLSIHIVVLILSVFCSPHIAQASGNIVEAVESEGSGKILPKILSRSPPVFPSSLARAGVEGTVVVTFTVDESGNVRDPEITGSDARQLNPYALKAVETWKFIPGARNGQTSPFRLRGSVEFSLKINPRGGQVAASTIATESKPAQSTVAAATDKPVLSEAPPSAFPQGAVVNYPISTQNNPPVAKRKPAPVYPYEMLISGQPGWADASFVVDYVGRPLFANPAGGSNRAFALAVVAMVEASAYTPIHKGKATVLSPTKEHYEFAGENSLDPEAKRILSELRKRNPSILRSNELDERPKVVQQVSPAYPRALKDDGMTGQAEIEFIIDRDGRVLFPRIVSATHEDFGWAAATAVAQWKFQPPQKGGHSVDVKMSVPILFTAQKLAEAD